MRKLVKVAMVACFLLAAVYFVDPGSAGGREVSADSTASAPARKLTAGNAPGIPLPAGFQSPCQNAQEHTLPLPTTVPPAQFVDFEKQILAFLENGDYKKSLGWCVDKGVRDTGPYFREVYYGTHPAVRIYYSPKVMQWLTGGREGPIPDGGMIIKEQFPPPSARYAGMSDDQLPKVTDWTIMIKDAKGAKDGWFWGEFFDGMKFDDDQLPFQYPWAGFGLYCLRCHSTAEKELTFSSLDNIKGFPGQPLTYPDDGSWRRHGLALTPLHHAQPAVPIMLRAAANPDFLQVFNSIPEVSYAEVQKLPSETYDNIAAPGSGPGTFISSSQCMTCHGGLNGPFGPVMFLPSSPAQPGVVSGANVSPYGEWRWSPMGLAGRDPIFFAQLESEFAFFETLPPPQNEQQTTRFRNACLTCHGAMGKRQFDTDSGGSGDFQLSFLQLTDRSDPHFKYGALARDGISCAVCHRTVGDQYGSLEDFLKNNTTGRFQVDTPDKIFGPFKDDEIAPLAMEQAIGIKPQFNSYIKSSRMCGSCHVIDMPVVDGEPGQFSLEQVTYLEWLNSQYQNEFGTPGPNAKSCQQCHMPGDYHNEKKGISVDQIQQKMAIIQDETYPETDHQVPLDKITIRTRKEGYSRHEFLGLNVFLLEMFNQFWDVLGVRRPIPDSSVGDDYMSGSKTDLQDAIDNFVQQAQERTAQLAVGASAVGSQQIQADVAVTNLAGHRFPSGVGFRRLFIELLVADDQGKVVWASGRTDNLGIIVDGGGKTLPSEFFTEYRDSQGRVQQHYQPHYEVITAQDQVQIYEELTQNADGKFTTNFVRRDHNLKDNRLLPIGWTENGPDPSLNGRFLQSTHAEGQEVEKDEDYHNGKGIDRLTYWITLPAGVDATKCTVKATLYYQSTPPYYLNDRFKAAPSGEATKRLYYLTSNLNLTGTAVENWKLKIVSTPLVPVAGGGQVVCHTLCFRAPQYYETNLSRLPRGSVTIAGNGSNMPVSTANTAKMKLALDGGSSAQDRFNQQFVAAQLTLLATPGSDQAAFGGQLICYRLSFTPVRLSNGVILSPGSTLGELIDQAQRAARQGSAADLGALAQILDLLNSNDPLGRCTP